MKSIRTALVSVLVAGAIPAAALATPKYHPEHPEHPSTPPPGSHGKAYGVYCRGESKKHVKGEKGTAFSRCVKAMAKADRNDGLSPKQACKGLSKKHVKGEKGTAFSRCVTGVAHLRRDQRHREKEEEAAAG